MSSHFAVGTKVLKAHKGRGTIGRPFLGGFSNERVLVSVWWDDGTTTVEEPYALLPLHREMLAKYRRDEKQMSFGFLA